MTTRQHDDLVNELTETIEHLTERQETAIPEEYELLEVEIAANRAELERLHEAFAYDSEEAA